MLHRNDGNTKKLRDLEKYKKRDLTLDIAKATEDKQLDGKLEFLGRPSLSGFRCFIARLFPKM
jgi:hypothetical protein